MIGFLQGKIQHIAPQYIIILVAGIGYKVYMNVKDISSLMTGSSIEVFIYHNVKEDAEDLYGFYTSNELEMFEMLISISGVGPKSGLGVLATASLEELQHAIVRSDPSILTKVSGIGKKTAERIVLELKGKLGSVEMSTQHTSSDDVQVIEALEGLGYSSDDARSALRSLDETIEGVDAKLKAALQILGR